MISIFGTTFRCRLLSTLYNSGIQAMPLDLDHPLVKATFRYLETALREVKENAPQPDSWPALTCRPHLRLGTSFTGMGGAEMSAATIQHYTGLQFHLTSQCDKAPEAMQVTCSLQVSVDYLDIYIPFAGCTLCHLYVPTLLVPTSNCKYVYILIYIYIHMYTHRDFNLLYWGFCGPCAIFRMQCICVYINNTAKAKALFFLKSGSQLVLVIILYIIRFRHMYRIVRYI